MIITEPSGKERRLPAARHVVFSERRGFTAVSVVISQERLAKLGAVRARIEIGANASLVPVAVEGDRFPQSAREIRQATGPSRALGTRVVDVSGKGQAARVLGTMINALPREGAEDSTRYDTLWAKAAVAGKSTAPNGAGIRQARQAYDQCLNSIKDRATYRLRGCLTALHDKFMRDLSVKYWNTGAGS